MGFQLIMSPQTTSKASSLGGVQALQRTVRTHKITQAAMEAARLGKDKLKKTRKAPRASTLALNRTSGRSDAATVESASDAKLRSRLISESTSPSELVSGVSADAVTGLLEGLGPAAATISEAHHLLSNALLSVECQALHTLPAVATKGVDRQWVNFLYKQNDFFIIP